tara:strand:- start:21570 stop:22013 length:444 start_codon:yes stop_codon:yes gene_type:complete
MKKLLSLGLISFCLLTTLNAQSIPCLGEKKFTSLEEALAEPEKVVYLDLGMHQPKLTAIPKEIAKFPNLKCLDVSFNQVALIPDEIKACKQLKVLNLAGNRYLAKLPAVLQSLPNLEEVNVTDIPEWNEEVKADAKNLLPDVKVITD